VTFRTFFVGAGTARALLRALLDGVPMVCPDPRAVPASRLLTMVDAEQVTVARMVPSVLRRALASAPSDLRLMTLQRVMSGGEPLLWTDVATLRRHMVPGSWVVHTYGSTETGSIARYAISFDDPIGSGVVPVGTAAPGRTVTVVDEAGLPVPTGETGRVVVEGRLGAHDERFELIEGGWQRFVTSDLGTIDSSGVLRLVGRSDDVVKIGAVRVDLATIEAVLRGAPDVAEVAVIAHGDAVRTTIVAHVVMASHHSASSEITTTGLRNFLAPRLVSAAVPHRFVLHPEPLPLLVSGKVDRRRLRELAEG
jgi:acyl-coenzyme A synthetase/AMP-(fatty) acid ligase